MDRLFVKFLDIRKWTTFDDHGGSMLPDEIRLEVTQEHLEQGIARWSRQCPVALALRTSFQGLSYEVLAEGTNVVYHQEVVHYFHDEAIRQFIRRFDDYERIHEQAEPFVGVLTRRKT